MHAFFNSFKKQLICSVLACLPFSGLQAQVDSTAHHKPLVDSERLDGSFAASWTTLIQQEIPGMNPDLFYRKQSRPLIVIDGVPMPSIFSNANMLDNTLFSSTEIGSVDFKQGPDAVARYGQRAANGVLIIRTKDGGFNKGFQSGITSGFAFETPFEEYLPAATNWQENAYLNWSNQRHSVHAGYSSKFRSTEEYTIPSATGSGLTDPLGVPSANTWDHAINAQLKSKYNEQFSTQVSGLFNEGDARQLRSLNTGLTYQPASWVNLFWNGGLNNVNTISTAILPFFQPIHIEQSFNNKETDLRLQFNHSLNTGLKLTAETGGAYYQQQYDYFVSQNTVPGDEPNTNKYEITNDYYRAFMLAGLEYKKWIRFKGGMQYQSYTSSNTQSSDRFNPYASLELEAGKVIPENKILSTLSLHTSYGQVQLTPLPQNPGPMLPTVRMSFQTHLKAGFFNDRLIFETTYFNDKNQRASFVPVPVNPATGFSEFDIQSTVTNTYSGFESVLRANILQKGNLKWTTGLNSLIIKRESLVDITQDDVIISSPAYPEFVPLPSSGQTNPWKWQTGLINRLTWKGFNLNTQLNLQNSTDQMMSFISVGEYLEGSGNPYGSIDGVPLYGPSGTIDTKKNYLLNLQEVTLSYSLPSSVLINSFFRKVTIGMSGRNLLIKSNTDESFYAYEQLQGSRSIVFPMQKQYSFNLGLHF